MSALDDLIERLERAHRQLTDPRNTNGAGVSYVCDERIAGKAQGVALALSYAREAKRDDDNDAKAEAAFREYTSEEDQ